ncbi:MAG: four helix bundle protein [Chthoniobacterales bacterium]
MNRESGATFEDLEVYQQAREFRKEMYSVARGLPEIEKFGLASQIRRAAVSLTNNIAEGHGRFHFLDQIKFTLQARGSLEELIDDLNVCADEQYLAPEKVASLKKFGWRIRQLIDGYIRYLRGQIKAKESSVREDPPQYAADAEFDPIHDSRFNDSR